MLHVLVGDKWAEMGERLFPTLATLSHPYVARTLLHGATSDTVWRMYSPGQESETLQHVLGKHKQLPHAVARVFLAQLALALVISTSVGSGAGA